MTVIQALHDAVLGAIPDAVVKVSLGSPGHYSIDVVSPVFQGKSMLQCQRLVYAAITHLMKGDKPPVHAVDTLRTSVPEA